MSDLRKIANDAENDCSGALWDYPEALRSAQDCIEELQARLSEVEAERDRQYDENANRIAQQAAAEAKLAKAREDALREAAARMKEKAKIEADYSPFNAACFDVAERSILALIEGETDE